MTWKNWAVGGLAAITSMVGASVLEAQESPSSLRTRGGSTQIESPYTGPERFSLGIHGGGVAERFDLSALETIANKIDMVRIGNRVRYPNGTAANGDFEHIIIEEDPYLERMGEMLGWERILLIINDKNDWASPNLTDAINDAETGFVQRAVHAFPQVQFIQVYNEPCNFDDQCTGEYLLHAKQAFEWKEDVENPRRVRENRRNEDNPAYTPKPELEMVCAATYGVSEGLAEFRLLVANGLLEFCDIIAIHDYTGGMTQQFAALRSEYGYTDKPMWLTETGSGRWEDHPEWYEQLAEIEEDMAEGYTGTKDQHIFWYSFYEGNGKPPGLQFGMIERDEDRGPLGWRATNEDMWTAIRARPDSSYAKEAETSPPILRRRVPDGR